MHGLAATGVWRVTPEDVDWGMALGANHYKGKFDHESVKRWALARLAWPSMVFLRSNHVLGVAHLAERYYAPGHPQAFLTLLYSEPGNYGREIVRVLEGLSDWASSKGASKFWFGDITGHDMGKLATVVGGRLAGHTYVVDLDNDPQTLG